MCAGRYALLQHVFKSWHAARCCSNFIFQLEACPCCGSTVSFCPSAASVGHHSHAIMTGTVAVVDVRSVATAVAAALASGVQAAQVEQLLSTCVKDLARLTVGNGSAGHGTDQGEQLHIFSARQIGQETDGEAGDELGASKARQRAALPPSGLTPRRIFEPAPMQDLPPRPATSMATVGRLAPVRRTLLDGSASSASSPNLREQLASAPSSAHQAGRSREASLQGPLQYKTAVSASALILESSALRASVRDNVQARAPLDVFSRRLEDLMRESQRRSQLEKDQKGLGNPSITLPLRLPTFEDELKARKKKKDALSAMSAVS